MKSILTVIGKDKIGIIAGISGELLKFNINILDVNQTIMDKYFTMIMMLEFEDSSKNFDKVKLALLKKGEDLGVDVKIQREEIFNSMHTL
ncbi:ACT domain-containing protein [Clostridium sp.]|uniref:ACT domain-containing protein n=1 Tax=Clostridium sp. TaxID=1506 RepID=UPI00261F9D79|nr:ACT domain-containing protein [Clostridium sp.]